MENKAHTELSANKSRKFGKREDRKKTPNGQKPANGGKKFDKRKGQNQKKKPKFIWSNRNYAEIVEAYEAQFPEMRKNYFLEKHQINEIGRSKRESTKLYQKMRSHSNSTVRNSRTSS